MFFRKHKEWEAEDGNTFSMGICLEHPRCLNTGDVSFSNFHFIYFLKVNKLLQLRIQNEV